MHTYTHFRNGIAMIELIFAIVIIGIVMLPVPNLLNQATKSSIVTFQQESIAIAASHANALMTYAWDEQNTLSQPSYTKNILTVTNGDNELNATSRVTLGNRQFKAGGVATAHLGRDSNLTVVDTMDDVDDFVVVPQTLSLTGVNNANQGDYIDQNITLSTAVIYGGDSANYAPATNSITFNKPFDAATHALPPVNGTTNIKLVTVRLTSNSASADLASKDIVMKLFMCNIGASNPQVSSSMGGGILVNALGGLF